MQKPYDALLELLRHDLPRMGIDVYTPEEDAMTYQEAVKIVAERERLIRIEGRAEGLAPLLRQFERRLKREMDAAERATLLMRLDTLGADRLGDVVLDLDAAQLASWLADPDAR